MKVNSTFENVKEFRRVLAHYAIMNEFAYYIEKSEPTRVTARCVDMECKWRIHASVMQDKISFEVKTLKEPHSCTRSNKGANKVATQGWVASVVRENLKSDANVSPKVLQNWIKKKYNVDVPYMKVFRGKEQAYRDIHGKWEDSFVKTNDFKGELLRRNPGSVVEVDFESKGNKKRFLRFFISFLACSKGFLDGCRPYISLDACHLKGKFIGVPVAATGVDGNSSIFPVAYGVLESENKNSWIWFLELLKKAIGTPNGLVISSDMQKEAFNSWIGEVRYQPVLDLLDSIREKIMVRLDKKRRLLKKWKGNLVPNTKTYLDKISKNLGEYEVCRSGENRAEVKYMDKRWEVDLDQRECTCRRWQVKGIPCVHAVAFIIFTRDKIGLCFRSCPNAYKG